MEQHYQFQLHGGDLFLHFFKLEVTLNTLEVKPNSNISCPRFKDTWNLLNFYFKVPVVNFLVTLEGAALKERWNAFDSQSGALVRRCATLTALAVAT